MPSEEEHRERMKREALSENMTSHLHYITLYNPDQTVPNYHRVHTGRLAPLLAITMGFCPTNRVSHLVQVLRLSLAVHHCFICVAKRASQPLRLSILQSLVSVLGEPVRAVTNCFANSSLTCAPSKNTARLPMFPPCHHYESPLVNKLLHLLYWSLSGEGLFWPADYLKNLTPVLASVWVNMFEGFLNALLALFCTVLIENYLWNVTHTLSSWRRGTGEVGQDIFFVLSCRPSNNTNLFDFYKRASWALYFVFSFPCLS